MRFSPSSTAIVAVLLLSILTAGVAATENATSSYVKSATKQPRPRRPRKTSHPTTATPTKTPVPQTSKPTHRPRFGRPSPAPSLSIGAFTTPTPSPLTPSETPTIPIGNPSTSTNSAPTSFSPSTCQICGPGHIIGNPWGMLTILGTCAQVSFKILTESSRLADFLIKFVSHCSINI
jgi:hypothetical protein